MITIVVSVVAIMTMRGWALGTTESISVVILIGFSVDYVIHLSADYMHSPYFSYLGFFSIFSNDSGPTQ